MSAAATLAAETFATRSGLEIMQAITAGELPQAPIALLLGFAMTAAGPGWTEFAATPAREHYNPGGSVHGGYAATLLDSAMACAVHTMLAAGQGSTTIDINVTYLKAMTHRTGPVVARGEVISSGRRVATARGTLTDADGRLLATATTTCLVFAVEAAPQSKDRS